MKARFKEEGVCVVVVFVIEKWVEKNKNGEGNAALEHVAQAPNPGKPSGGPGLPRPGTGEPVPAAGPPLQTIHLL